MTMQDAIAAQPQWVQIWLNVLGVCAFLLPAALLIWRASRLAGAITVIASALAGIGVFWIFNQFGFVRLLGLPHIILWLPVVIYLARQSRRPDMPTAPRAIMYAVMAVMCVSLVFDVVDVARYALGDRAAF